MSFVRKYFPFVAAAGPEVQEVHDICALKRDDC
jgi:hypothetical protein